MSLADRIALFRLERRLRALQREYYEAKAKNESGILDYFRTLQAARELHLRGRSTEHWRRRVHLGSGDHRLPGWINVDRDPAMPVDVAADLTYRFPFRADSVDLIHSEDFIEHVDGGTGAAVLRECHRVLRSGGVMRLVTPDLRTLVEEVYIRRDARHLRWCDAYLEAHGPCEALNMHMRMGGEHRFIYDEERLTALLREIGFDVRRVRYNRSPVPELCYLDLRDFGLNLFIEAVKR